MKTIGAMMQSMAIIKWQKKNEFKCYIKDKES